MEKTNYHKLNPNLNKIGRLCRKCRDIFWNKEDCKSIEQSTFCSNCMYYNK